MVLPLPDLITFVIGVCVCFGGSGGGRGQKRDGLSRSQSSENPEI